MRVGLVVLMILGALGLAAYGTCRGVKAAIDRLVYDNPRFAIHQVVVQDDGVLKPERVMEFAGVQVGQNLLSVDLDRVRSNLEMLPLVRAVEVRRILPDRLLIHIDERIAVAQLRVPTRELKDTAFYIDRAGVVMKPVRLSDGTLVAPQMPRPVPTLTGVALDDVRVGCPVQSDQIYCALELLDRLDQAVAGSWLDVEQVDLSKPRELIMTTRQHTIVKVDVENYPQQLRRL